MNNNSPLISGWFYFWLVLTSLLIWADHSGYLAQIEALNLRLASLLKQEVETEDRSFRVVVSRKDHNEVGEFEKVIIKYPNATIAILADLNSNSIQQINRLNLQNREILVLSNTAISSNRLAKSNFIQRWLITNAETSTWTSLANLELTQQPIANSNAMYLVVQKGANLYPTLVTSSIKNYHRQASGQITLEDSKITFNSAKPSFEQLDFGLHGLVYPINYIRPPLDFEELSELVSNEFDGILLLDDFSNPAGGKTHQTLLSLQNNNYLVINGISYLIYLLLWFFLSVVIFSLSRYSLARRNMLIGLIIIFCLVAQVSLINFSIWLPIQSLLCLAILAVIINFGLNRERRLLITNQDKLNEVLAETALDFLRNQKAQQLISLLENTQPNLQLIESIKEVATEAEAYKNISIASQLYHWILSHDKNHAYCKQRLQEIDQLNEPEDLTQTIVIDGNENTQPATSNNLLAIKNFGRYQVEGILGKGAMGVVFQGVDPKINRHVAIKTLQLHDDLDDESLTEKKQRFFREAETAGNLSHANIVTIYDVGEQKHENSNQSLGYIAMDLLTGAPLSEFVKKDKLLPPSLVYQLMIQMTDALDYAHRQKVIHRDIKPANIIFDDDLQRGTLTDFGIAYMSDHSKTKTGTIMGSPYYMSPEQVMGKTVDGRSDIFSLGVTFYQLLSGHLPFNGESIATVAFHITKTKHESVRNLNKKLLTSSTRITNKAMQKDPTKRYQSMQEFRQALVNALKRDYKKSPL